MITEHLITDAAALSALYPAPVARALGKESPVLTPGYVELLAAAPFCIVATHGPAGIDCSPRGDPPGFVQVLDERTLLLPDRRGNNRLDTLRNLLHDPAIALIFLIPGMGEAVRVRGTAVISTDPDLLERCRIQGVLPATVLVVSVDCVYFQCQRALLRSGLWDPAAQVDRSTLPSTGRLQQELGQFTAAQAAEYDATLADYAAATLYEGPTKA
ncbi:pyridoxamine 5'-phosphate oxidase family protein [Nakamurella sp. YIM 132087]|uniref:Pyridoxamine 5'-phosphate oxidase family protein n=1 Tax=Nakamurella alba TaxID=2665158 RepID=A0A7K1FSA1_9ACTN|nr:pyridoxamine 5'-phosphate oxidase family protein [Nakamurella alba]